MLLSHMSVQAEYAGILLSTLSADTAPAIVLTHEKPVSGRKPVI